VPDLLAELLSSKVRAAVLGHLLPRPHLGFGLTDLSRLLDLPISSVQHECYKLVRLGVLRDHRAKSSRHYRPDPSCPLLMHLTSLVLAEIGTTAGLRAAVEGLPHLETAFLVFPPSEAPAERHLLVLVGELSIEEVDDAFARALAVLNSTHRLPRDLVDPLDLAYFRPGDWRSRIAAGNSYALSLRERPGLVLAADGTAS
jgi:hypothetical protein